MRTHSNWASFFGSIDLLVRVNKFLAQEDLIMVAPHSAHVGQDFITVNWYTDDSRWEVFVEWSGKVTGTVFDTRHTKDAAGFSIMDHTPYFFELDLTTVPGWLASGLTLFTPRRTSHGSKNP